MNIFVTGGAGYIGSLLLPTLLEAGHRVTLYDSFLWGLRPILHFAANPDLTIIEGDVRDRAKLHQSMKGHDIVCHLAAIVGYPACSQEPEIARAVNVDGTRNVCEGLEAGQRLIFASTGSTYGKVEGVCTEELSPSPLSLYGSTKWEGEIMALERGGVGLRFATVFGLAPRLRLDLLVNDFVYQALRAKQIVLFEGHARRTFMHCRDAALIYPFVIDHFEQMSGQAYNIGDESMNFNKRDIARKIAEYVPFYLHEADVGSDADARDYEVSYEKIKALGFRCTVSFDEGIKELIKVLTHLRITNEWRNA